MTEYAPGTPSWIDLSTPDIDGAVSFYGEVMGWTATEPEADTGGYRRFQLDGRDVAGAMPHMNPGQPTAWSTYVTVEDADATAAAVGEAGGTTIVPPMDVLDIGRMAMFIDPTGAAIGVWQPKTFTGAEIVNEPNSLCWNDVMTRDAETAKGFYTSVFGWEPRRPQFRNAPESYTVWELNGNQVGGMMQMTDEFFPPDVPPHWNVCFAVADVDATVAKATEAGATVLSGRSTWRSGDLRSCSTRRGPRSRSGRGPPPAGFGPRFWRLWVRQNRRPGAPTSVLTPILTRWSMSGCSPSG